MLIDAPPTTDGEAIAAGLCIVGGGLAGITLASTFFGTDTRVVLLESGRVGESAQADDLSTGKATAHPYHPLSEASPRQLGGAADAWGARCRPFDSIDFEQRDWPWSGWPVTFEEMSPYYEKARMFLRMSDLGFTGEGWADGLPPLYRHIQDSTSLKIGVWQESPLAPISETYGDLLQNAENVSVYLGATGLEIMLGSDDSVSELAVGTFEGTRFTVRADQFVLAGGAFGTTRLLLASNNQMKDGVGNDHGMVGRFFAEHPHIVAGVIPLSRPVESSVGAWPGTPARAPSGRSNSSASIS